MSDPKSIFASKTFWFNILTVVAAVAVAFGFGEFTPDAWTAEAITAIVAVVNIALRFVTKQPVTL